MWVQREPALARWLKLSTMRGRWLVYWRLPLEGRQDYIRDHRLAMGVRKCRARYRQLTRKIRGVN